MTDLNKQPLIDDELELMKDTLDKVFKENEYLKKVNQELYSNQISFRDEIAKELFIHIFDTVSDPEKATEDAYRAADAFIRIRDKGRSYQEEILESLMDLAFQNQDNANLGVKVRLFIQKHTGK